MLWLAMCGQWVANFHFPFYKISAQKQWVAWNFVIVVENFDTGSPSLVAITIEYLFAYQFWYWELCA